MAPKITVITPVYNRTDELRRALDSLARQSMADFECLVIDDCSTVEIEPVVREYDERFHYVRTSENGGPSTARLVGYERMEGDYLVHLDSDNELFPWALDRATHYLSHEAAAGGVAGLYAFTSGLRTRVKSGVRLTTPQDFARGERSPYDMVGMVRREVVTEWLEKGRGYFSAEFHQWFTFAMRHNQLVVDEPWGKYHESNGPRVSTGTDDRKHNDVRLFVEEHRPTFGAEPCAPLDEYLGDQWVRLRRVGRPELALVEAWMRERGLSRLDALKRRALKKVPARSRTFTL